MQVCKKNFRSIYFWAYCLLFSAATVSLSAQEPREAEIADLRKKISDVEKLYKKQKARESETLDYINVLDEKINLTKNLVSKYRQAALSQRQEIRRLEKRQVALEEDLSKLKKGFANRLVSLYKYGRVPSLALLLNADSYKQVEVWSLYHRRLAEDDARKIKEIRSRQDSLVATHEKLGQAFEKENALLTEKTAEEKKLAADRKEKNGVLKKIRRDKTAYQKQLDDYKNAIDQIQRLIAESEKKVEREKKAQAEQPVQVSADVIQAPAEIEFDFAANRGRLYWPVAGEIKRAYGPYKHPVLKTTTDNLGLDITVSAGAKVSASAPGVVTAITWQRGRGNLIIINHSDGYYTVYTHIDEIFVELQQTVAQGQVIGAVGEGQSLDGPLVHFQVWQKFDHLNPTDWLEKKQ